MNTPDPQSSTPSPPKTKTKALARLVELLAPRPASRQSQRGVARMVAAGFRWTPSDVEELDATLQAEYEPAQLLATGCYESDARGRLQLIASLRRPDAPVAVIRRAPGRQPHSIAAPDRPVNRPPAELDYVVDDARRLRVEAAGGVWLAVASGDDAVEWLRRTNLAAVPIGQLSRRPGLQDKFWRAFAAQERGQSDETKFLRQQLASRRRSHEFVAHCPTEMDPQWHEQAKQLRLDAILVTPDWDCRTYQPLPDDAASHLELLRQLQRAAPDGYAACGVWAPSAETLEQLRSLARSKDEEPFAAAIQQSLAAEIHLLPAEREAPPDTRNENPNDLRRRLHPARSYEEFDELKRRYRAAMEQSLIAPVANDVDLVGAQRQHVGNLLLQRFLDAELEYSLSRDRHPFSAGDRSPSAANICKLAATWLDVHNAGSGGRHARRR